MGAPSQLTPTFQGHIASTHDALILFEACLSGAISHVARRPHDRERSGLIQSGNVFIYEEHSSGIKRWTDGVPWSPSRILGNFLVYRELDRPFPPGEKKRAMKRSKTSPHGLSKSLDSYGGVNSGYNLASGGGYDPANPNSLNKETERSLIGSLIDSYGFKDGGLVKKTVSVTIGGISHHLVSYYTVADILNNKFTTPTKDPHFQHIIPRPDLITKQNFRTPINEVDALERMEEQAMYAPCPQTRSSYELTNQSVAHRSMSLPMLQIGYGNNPGLPSNYCMTNTPGTYNPGMQPPLSSPGYNGQFAPSAQMYPIKSEGRSHIHGDYRQQRYNSDEMNVHRSAMPPPINTSWSRRGSAYDEAAVSGISPVSVDSKITQDSGYSSYGSIRDGSSMSQDYAMKRSLPTPHMTSPYERPPTHQYSNMDHTGIKENSWQIGQQGTGHGHYIASQNQWASSSYNA